MIKAKFKIECGRIYAGAGTHGGQRRMTESGLRVSRFSFPLVLCAVACFLAVCFLSACTTDIASLKNPGTEFSQFEKVVFACKLRDLEMKAKAEEAFLEEFADNGKNLLPEESVVNPFRSYSGEEYVAMLQEADVDAVLVMEMLASDSETVPVYTTGGIPFYYSETVYGFSFYLFDLKKNEIAWKASTETNDGNFFTEGQMFASIAESVYEDLFD